MPDSPGRPAPGPDVLVLRAAFVPEGQQPPPEFLGDFNPLRIPATFDPETGEITCVNAGISFGGDIRAWWHPDEGQGADDGEDAAGQDNTAWGTGGSEGTASRKQSDETWGAGNRSAGLGDPARSGGWNASGVAGNGPGDASGDRSSAPAARPYLQSTGQDTADPAMKPPGAASTSAATAESRDDREDAPIPPPDAGGGALHTAGRGALTTL